VPLLTFRHRPPLTAPQRASMVSWLNDTLTERCTIQRVVGRVPDGQGGEIDTWADVGVDVPCRLRSIVTQAPEQLLGERLTGVLPWTIVLPDGQDVTVEDRIVLTSQTPNRIFQVSAIPGTDTLSVATEVTVAEVEATA
jgi:head-tail adaptor